MTTTTAPAVPSVTPPVPPMALAVTGSLAEQATQIADGLAAGGDAQLAAALAAFAGAHLPVIGPEGTSLTPTDDPIGFRWSAVWASAAAASTTRTPLSQTFQLLSLVNPGAPFDAAAAANELVAGLRSALASAEPTGPAFLAHLVAEQARRANGVELSDPVTTADQILLDNITNLAIASAGLRAVFEGFVESGGIPVDADAEGLAASEPLGRRARRITAAECADDGADGWVLWIASKVAAGTQLPGVPLEWKGMWNAFAEIAQARGLLTTLEVETTANLNKFIGSALAVLNVLLFAAQLDSRSVSVTMDGEGPLVRTKTDTHGTARTITVSINYDKEDPKIVQRRNCALALLSVIGNNSLQAIGAAAGVEVEISGGEGFANSLAPGDSTVLFGPAEFTPVVTADANGSITVPVQGRAQKKNLPEDAAPVAKEFSILAEASLDPVNASTIGKALADDLLCLSTVVGGGGVIAAVTECQNAVLDTIKQFHWDLGEFTFPLTDWSSAGWRVEGSTGPFTVRGTKCGGDDGPWFLTISGEGYTADATIAINGETLEGAYEFLGTATYGSATFTFTGTGTVRFVKHPDGTGELQLTADTAQVSGAGATAAGSLDGIVLPVYPLEECSES